ncbi:MAG: IclR family transcriptional regulator [Planctomycetes bacterium]|nr:IclR family transcriptional regulator [Planctomycetota bacterium]
MAQPLLQSVDNALRIIELFDGSVKELGLTDISRSLNLGKSTVHRLLTTMEGRGFIEQNPDNGRYRLGIRPVHIGAGKLGSLNVIDECHPVLERLSAVTGETSHLSFYANGLATFVDTVNGANPTIISSLIGFNKPAHASASGKLFLAHTPDSLEEIVRFLDLPPQTPFTITSRHDLIADLDKIRRQGYAEDQQEGNEGLVGFAAPVWGPNRKLVAAISVSGPTSRMNARKEMLCREVMAAAQRASARCGWKEEERRR